MNKSTPFLYVVEADTMQAFEVVATNPHEAVCNAARDYGLQLGNRFEPTNLLVTHVDTNVTFHLKVSL